MSIIAREQPKLSPKIPFLSAKTNDICYFAEAVKAVSCPQFLSSLLLKCEKQLILNLVAASS